MPINQLQNTAKVTLDGSDILSNTVTTLLQLPPTIVKSVSLLAGVKIGDTITYTVVITNVNLSSITNLPFVDPLPEGCQYVSNSFKVNGTAQTANYDNETNTLSYTLTNIAALGVVTLTFQVLVVEVEEP